MTRNDRVRGAHRLGRRKASTSRERLFRTQCSRRHVFSFAYRIADLISDLAGNASTADDILRPMMMDTRIRDWRTFIEHRVIRRLARSQR